MKSHPSICFVAPNAFPLLAGDDSNPVVGGAELQQVLLARGLAQRGYKVSMVCLDFGQPDDLEIDGIRILRAFAPDEGIPVLRFFWPRLTSIWRCLKKANAEIYYQRTAGMLTGIVAAYCRHAGRKSIFAAAGNPDFDRPTSRIRYARDRWIYQYGIGAVNAIVVQNDAQKRLSLDNYARESVLIPNGFPQPTIRTPVTGKNILWVSTIRSLKRPQLFLDLAKALPGFSFEMVGGLSAGEPALFDSIRERAAGLSNVEFRGFVPYTKIDAYFDGAAIFVNTSESEGFPNTFLQSWCRGIPTVSFVDCGARAGDRMIGAQPANLDEMVTVIKRWMGDGSLRRSEGERCRKYFFDNHSLPRVLDRYTHLFEELGATDA